MTPYRKARLLRAFLRFCSMFFSIPFVLGLALGLVFSTHIFLDAIYSFDHKFVCELR